MTFSTDANKQHDAPMTADEIMRAAHNNLRDDYPRGILYAQGAADALLAVGLLSASEHRLWHSALLLCPGHSDEGGRVFCAYGCKLPVSNDTNEQRLSATTVMVYKAHVATIVLNYIADPSYSPYCSRCPGLVRMELVEPFLWKHDCGAIHDERQVLEHG